MKLVDPAFDEIEPKFAIPEFVCANEPQRIIQNFGGIDHAN
ncbi:MAG TPA: hypothetical protein VKR52_01995 [Terracidiphilus sp.]|nr:hypothetical protein [Terracidiphilus sp.]